MSGGPPPPLPLGRNLHCSPRQDALTVIDWILGSDHGPLGGNDVLRLAVDARHGTVANGATSRRTLQLDLVSHLSMRSYTLQLMLHNGKK